MRFAFVIMILACLPLGLGAALSAQSAGEEQTALRAAKQKAVAARERSEQLRQEAANAADAADRLLAQRAVLSADIEAADAQIQAARARIRIIEGRQKQQALSLGRASEPILRLNAALRQLTSRPAIFLLAQPGSRQDYMQLRAVMDTVQPEIERRTAALRQRIAIQKDLRNQQQIAIKSLSDATKDLQERRKSLAALESANRGSAGSLNAAAAAEFERAIAQGERARDIVEDIDTTRLSGENAATLAALDGPQMRENAPRAATNNRAYVLPEEANLVFGVSELNETGYRERGLRLSLPAGADMPAPAAGRVGFAGIYRSYGKIVIIEHGGGWTTLVTNLDNIAVDEGQQVGQGTVLGQVQGGESEVTLELRRKGRVMDIAALLL